MLKLLLVDDNETFRLGMKAKLERVEDFVVVGVSEDGLQAVEAADRLEPDVVVMDIEMPFIDGIEATQRIKARKSGIGVIMLTAHEKDDGIFASFAAGADGYCLKGADIGRITLAIRSVADGAVWLDPGIANRVLKEPPSLRKPSHDAPAPSAQRLAKNMRFSEREKDVLRLVADGMSNPQIAEKLLVAPATVKTHLRRIMEKLVVDDRTQAAVKALRQGII